MTTIEVLTNDQRAQVHERTLHVLAHRGFRVGSAVRSCLRRR